ERRPATRSIEQEAAMIPASVTNYLEQNHARYSVIPHRPAYTAQEEAAPVHGRFRPAQADDGRGLRATSARVRVPPGVSRVRARRDAAIRAVVRTAGRRRLGARPGCGELVRGWG